MSKLSYDRDSNENTFHKLLDVLPDDMPNEFNFEIRSGRFGVLFTILKGDEFIYVNSIPCPLLRNKGTNDRMAEEILKIWQFLLDSRPAWIELDKIQETKTIRNDTVSQVKLQKDKGWVAVDRNS